MNYLWICCRGLVSFTHLQGPSGGTEVSPVWILQGLIRVVFTTAAIVGDMGLHLLLSESFCEMWNTQSPQSHLQTIPKVWSKGQTEDMAPQALWLREMMLRRGTKLLHTEKWSADLITIMNCFYCCRITGPLMALGTVCYWAAAFREEPQCLRFQNVLAQPEVTRNTGE